MNPTADINHGAHRGVVAESFKFQTRQGEQLTLEEAVFQALGFASVCWTERPRGVFESDRAKEAGDALLAFIKKAWETREVDTWFSGYDAGGAR